MLSNAKELSFPRLAKRKRGDIDIIASILNEAHEGARKTRIMYKCNLSHSQLKVYLKLLFRMKLLEITSEGTKPDVLKTAAKGREFLDTYRKLEALMI
jgi:predicted transcriptional regulator